jgi:NhaP-type Na+/H+ or K+/H+ antiporter
MSGNTQLIDLGATIVFIMMMLYMVIGSQIEKYHCKFGHEAAYTILIGLLVSVIVKESHHEKLLKMLEFSDNTFFYVCLPPIVFSSGFNMQRGNFFSNIKMIILLGLFATICCFGMFSMMTMAVNNSKGLHQYSGKTGEWSILELSNSEILLMCSLLCSSDVIAAISLISYDEQPKLFSIVFGEGIMNDAVSIILFNTVMKYVSGDNHINWQTPLAILLDFIMLAGSSLLVGVIFGLISATLHKKWRAFSNNPVSECLMIFCFGYLAYLVSEVVKASGIISLLTSGIIMAHYTWFNLSPQGKQSSFIIFQFLGFILEAFVFSYLGLTFFSYSELMWSFDLFLVELGIILLARFMGTVGLVCLLDCCKFNSGVSFKELCFIWYAGLIRGAIAFGLVLRINDSFPNRNVIITTSLSLVIFTTVIFGSTVGLVSKCLFRKSAEEDDEDDYHILNKKTVGTRRNTKQINEDGTVEDVEVSSSESDYERMMHPNEESRQ